MATEEGNKVSRGERLREDYKMIVYRTEDFSEVRRFDLNLGSIYTAISMIFVGMVLLFFLLFAFTPLKRMIPGYGKIESNEQFIKLVGEVDKLSNKVEAQETYLKSMRNLVSAAAETDGGAALAGITPNKKIEAKPSTSSVESSDDKKDENLAPLPTTDERAMLFATMRATDLIKPVDGVISSEFKPEIGHYGIDILGPKNTAIKSMMDGYVFSSGWDLETGYTIGVQHKGNILTFYKHNSTLLKEKGTFVKAGEAIAIIGNTGTHSTGPHLHFELWHNGKPVNPTEVVNF